MHGGAGGGHGGIGGRAGDGFNPGGATYGDAFAPVDLGSGGGPGRTAAASGGGAITLSVSDTLRLDGEITANGANAPAGNCFSAPGGGGGAGGSIFITAQTITGTGAIRANGGMGGDGGCFPGVGDDGGGGAGGRIAVLYGIDGGFAGFTTSSVNGAPGGGRTGAPGTMVFIDTATDTLRISQNLELPADSSASFGAVTVDTGATLTLGGGSLLTVESDFVVTGNSRVILQAKNTSSQVGGQWQGAGATIDAANVRVDAGSRMSADAQGYLAGLGPGAGGADGGMHGGAGGGHGGIGGRAGDGFNPGGATYGDAFAPVDLGSGGGPARTAAASGGGAITLNVSDTLRLDGEITANGADAAHGNCFSAPAGGGGAGGSIFVTTATLTGAGALRANGGTGGDGGCSGVGDDGGGGAGGRIAVLYAVDGDFGGFTTSSVNGGLGGGRVAPPGTMVFLNTVTNALRVSQHLDFPPDASVSFGAVMVDDGATLALGGGATLTVENDLIVRGGSTLIVESKNANGQVKGRWEGAGVTINAGNVSVEAGSAISANGQGYAGGQGPGAGGSGEDRHPGGGGGYGGMGGAGGDSFYPGGATYGRAFAPVDLGSGGGLGGSVPGAGGGAVTLNVADALILDGVITANGSDGGATACFNPAAGGGAGGSILIITSRLAGVGSLQADGGDGGPGGCSGVGDDGGGGGGGRIAVHFNVDDGFAGVTTSTVNGGERGQPSEPGTLLFISCAGDCNGDGEVTVNELVQMVNVALSNTGTRACIAGDKNHDEAITVDEILTAVSSALQGCAET
jgi:hypothetical protein